MESTFPHQNASIPSDQAIDNARAPLCNECSGQMWLTRIETELVDGGARSHKNYECKVCGTNRCLDIEDYWRRT